MLLKLGKGPDKEYSERV